MRSTTLLISLCLSILLCGCSANTDHAVTLTPTPSATPEFPIASYEDTRVPESDITEVDDETRAEIERIRSEMYNLSPAKHGGYYHGANNLYTHINYIEGKRDLVPQTSSEFVIYHEVKYSIHELEEAHKLLIPYMGEYGISTIYVNDSLNKIRICVYNPKPTLTDFLAELYPDPDMYYIEQAAAPMQYQ